MAEINLTDEEYRMLPFKDTEVRRAKTYGEIIGLFEAHGISDYQFIRVKGEEAFRFPIKVKHRGVEQSFLVKLTVPRLMYAFKTEPRNRYSPKKVTYMEDVSWRVFWWYLKNKLTAIECGLTEDVTEFMQHITYAVTDGSTGQAVEKTLGEDMMDRLDKIPQLRPVEERKALTG